MRATSPRLSIRSTVGLHASELASSVAEVGRSKHAASLVELNRGEVAPPSQSAQAYSGRPQAVQLRVGQPKEGQPQSACGQSTWAQSACSRSACARSIRGRSIRARSIRSGSVGSEEGQATVEFALVLVALVGVVWALLSLCLVVRDQVLVTHASREAARTYAVTRSVDAATQAARDRSGLGENLLVTVEPQADNLARLTVSLNISSRIPLMGRVRPGMQLQSTLITYVEPA